VKRDGYSDSSQVLRAAADRHPSSKTDPFEKPCRDRKSDNEKVSFDRTILFELFMIPLQMRVMQETKEFELDLVNKCSARVSPPADR
jgi:hypothetical protein